MQDPLAGYFNRKGARRWGAWPGEAQMTDRDTEVSRAPHTPLSASGPAAPSRKLQLIPLAGTDYSSSGSLLCIGCGAGWRCRLEESPHQLSGSCH